MQYDLVSASDYLSFPRNPKERWLALEARCRASMNELITTSISNEVDDLLRYQYMNTISAAADELGIDGISQSHDIREFKHFLGSVTRVATRLRLQTIDSNSSFSVSLTRSTRLKILHQVERLRDIVSNSDLDTKKKQQALKKLDELQVLTLAQRTDFGSYLATLGFIALVAGGTTSFLADAPGAIATITALIGEEKESEEEEQRQIDALQKPLQIGFSEDTGMDDEIPF